MRTTNFFKAPILLCVLWCTLYAKCELPDTKYDIDLISNADYAIGYYFADYAKFYPDTLLPETNDFVMYDIREVMKAGLMFSHSQETFFDRLPQDTLSAFIFHTDTLNKYSWAEVRDGYKILKRYDLSLQDVQRLNYKIYFPPTEAMKNMKMYPPYEK